MGMRGFVAALARHREAFLAEAEDDREGAEGKFRQALRAIACHLDDGDLLDQLARRAASYPKGGNSPEAVATMFTSCLPDWLIDVHLGRCALALSQSRIPCARMHWGLVLAGEKLGQSSYGRAVDDCRSWMESRFLPSMSDAPETRMAQLELGERLLSVDPDHRQLRRRLLDGYAASVQTGLELPARAGHGRSRPARSEHRLVRGRLNPARLRRHVRRLRLHALALSRTEYEQPMRERLAQVFRLLAEYGKQESDEDFVERMQRHARRLARPCVRPEGATAMPFSRPGGAPPPALEKNPFQADGNPYDRNPLSTLGVSPTDDDGTIAIIARQPGSGPQELDPRVAQRLLEDRVLRLAYDLMQEATTTDAGVEP